MKAEIAFLDEFLALPFVTLAIAYFVCSALSSSEYKILKVTTISDIEIEKNQKP